MDIPGETDTEVTADDALLETLDHGCVLCQLLTAWRDAERQKALQRRSTMPTRTTKRYPPGRSGRS